MNFLKDIFSNPLYKHLEENIDKAIDSGFESDGDEDITSIVVDDYFHLLKRLTKKKPQMVTLDPEYLYSITADGKYYDLDILITPNDSKNTERKMEIEALVSDGVSIDTVQTILNEKIQNEW